MKGIGCGIILFIALLLSSSQSAHAQLTEVFIIAHSHCDAGWLQTLDSYYYENVTLILDQVTHTLVEDETKKFSWSEIVFFSRWWNEQNKTWQGKVRELVRSGRLEFVGGGWVQNDEADTHYTSVINQMTLGHQFLLDAFGITPVVGWQIDPFGASTLTPVLWNLTGLKYHVINRVDDRLKRNYISWPNSPGSGEYSRTKQFEFYWQASKNYGPSVDMFTHILEDHYFSPQLCWLNPINPLETICTGFDFEGNTDTNPPINSTNLQERSDVFAGIIKARASYFIHNKLMLMFGNDFRFQNASVEFDNMDKLIDNVNHNSQQYGMILKYATPSEYFDAVAKVTQKSQFPLVLNRDYFAFATCTLYEYLAYGSCASYWSGFYTSYPVLKEFARSRDALLSAADTIFVVGNSMEASLWHSHIDWPAAYDQIDILRKACAVLNHHDAITGTSRSHVLSDYFDLLEEGTNSTNYAIASVLSFIMANKEIPHLSLSGDFKHFNPGMVMPLVLYNSLGWKRNEIAKILIETPLVRVFDSHGWLVQSQVIGDIACARHQSANCGTYLFFEVTLPPLGYATYFIENIRGEYSPPTTTRLVNESFISLENSYYRFTFERNSTDKSYHLTSAINIADNLRFSLNHEILEYIGVRDDPYKFRPNGTAEAYVASTPQVYYSRGPVVTQLSVIYNLNLTVIYRLYANSSFLEVEHWASLAQNRQMISRFTTPNINASNTFYTDNGLELQKRVYQARFNESSSLSLIASNYYPVVSTATITDGIRQLVVLTNQTLGGSSQSSNSLELMIHRSTNGKHPSLNEIQNDTSTAHITFRLILGSKESTDNDRVPSSYTHQFAPLPVFGAPDILKSSPQKFIANWTDHFRASFSPLAGIILLAHNLKLIYTPAQLPQNLHLLGLKPLSDTSLYTVMRFVHLYEQGQSPTYSQPTTLDLAKFFAEPINVYDFYESTLTATQALPSTGGWTHSFNPGELKTFVANLQ